MKIYTKTGDTGNTSLFGGQRVPKDALRIDAYGTVDELNSALGVVLSDVSDAELKKVINRIQNTLFEVGADLATPRSIEQKNVRRIKPEDAKELESVIDATEQRLEPLTSFVLPGGSKAASGLHVARTICRRAERAVVRLSREEEIGEGILVYLNRLSDLLFVLARWSNKMANVPEIPWNK
jgi:cob(I)alamin adenosyltransferase